MKRIVSFILALVMVLGMVPQLSLPAKAEETGQPTANAAVNASQWPTLNSDLTHIICYGQSFSTGSDAPYYPDPTVDGVYVYGNIANSSNGTELTPLSASAGNQHPIISAGNVLAQLLAGSGYDTDIVLGSYGAGGRTIAQLMSSQRQQEIKSEEGYSYDIASSGRYEVFRNSVSALAQYAQNNGQSISCPVIVYLQGETDQNTDEQLGYPENANRAGYGAGGDKEKYKEYMTRLKEDMQQEVMTQYGQTEKPLFMIYQVSGTYTRTQYSSINMAQIEFAQENEDVILVQTPYFTSHYTNSHHLTQNGYRWLGEYIGRYIYTALVEQVKPWPMLPEKIEVIDEKTIRLTIRGAQGGLAIDTWTVENATNSKNRYGFYLQLDYSNVVPTNVTVSGNTIDLTLAESANLLTAETVYLYYAGKNASGTGNIRDNCTDVGFYEYLDDSNDTGTGNNQGVSHSSVDAEGNSLIGRKYPLYNWLASFCYEVEVPEGMQRKSAAYHWQMQDNELVDVAGNNALTLLEGSVSNGILTKAQYSMEKTIVLEYDRPWAIEWKAAGNGSSYGGGKLLAASSNNGSYAQYLYIPADTRGMVAWGVSSDSANYGFRLANMGIDTREEHTYRIENRIAGDGVNSVYLIVDGAEIGAMNTGYRTSASESGAVGSMIEEPKNWANGKNLYLDGIGAGGSFLLNNLKLSYLKVFECVHTYTDGICIGCGAEDPNHAETLALRYDDHYDITGKTVEIIDAGAPTSYQVGYGVAEGTLDEAVVTLEDNYLVATGIGTAVVKIDGIQYEVTVEAAPISLLLLIGQSNMRGSEGDANQSIVCPDGMVYATFGDERGDAAGIMNVNNARKFAASALTGPYSTINVEGTTEHLSFYPIYSLTADGAGTFGPDSGFAYEWVKQTGEKVWIVNAAHGGSSITSWQPNATNFKEAVLLFSACQETLQKEIDAGHFTLSHMGYFWCQGCTDRTQTAQWYVEKYLAMHENLKTELSMGDRTFEFAGIIPVRVGSTVTCYRDGVYETASSYSIHQSYEDLRFSGPRAAQYWMTNNPDLPDIWNVCNIGEDWVWMPDGTNGVTEYFQQHYPGGTVDYTTQVAQKASWYTPTTPAAVHDTIHYNQIGYNEVGREAARNALILLGEIAAPEVETTVKLLGWDGITEVTTVDAYTTGRSETLVVPKVYPVWKSKEVTYTLSAGLTWEYYDLLVENDGIGGQLTASIGNQTITITGHTWSDWETISEASADGPGEQRRTCSHCGKTDVRYIDGVWQIYDLTEHLQELPEGICCDSNIWNLLTHESVHFTSGKKWGTTSTPTTSITFPVNPGDKIYATSWNKAGENGHETSDGIRLTFFNAQGIALTMGPGESYRQFAANGGYLVAPEGSIALNVVMWYDSPEYEVYILNREHNYVRGICTGCGAADPNGPVYLDLRYDDHYDITGKTVEILDAGTPTSVKIGSGVAEGTRDDAVVAVDGNYLIAAGIGTATVKIDGVLHEITVEPAPISLFMITGHSMGAGQQGSKDLSVVGPAGQVYSSHGTTNLGTATAGVGISFAAGTRAKNVNAFTEAGSGTVGEGSALAWEYNRLTGEKVWVLNTAVGGSNLTEWIPGTGNYRNAVAQFQRAQAILANEIRAGHYTLSNMGILYHNGANFSHKGVEFTQQDLQQWYDAMWNGFKSELTTDLNQDGNGETVEFLGLVPIWTKSAGVSYTQDEPAGWFMSASEDYPDIFTASVIGKDWLTNANVAANFPEISYTVQNGSAIQRPATTAEVFASDNVHYLQVGYNAVGEDIARNLVQYLTQAETAPEVKLLVNDGKEEAAEEITLNYGTVLLLTPVTEPITAGELTFEVSGCISLSYPLQITAAGNGTGTLTVSYNGTVLKTITFTCDDAPAEQLALRYDDHYDITGKTVEILDAGSPTSCQVGYSVAEGTRDTAVVTVEGNYLVATGIGTAVVKIDGVIHEVTVEAAPISILLLIGQSNMQGSEGDENQSIICPEGMVYSTYGDRYTMTTSNATNFAPSALTGAGSRVNVNGTTANLEEWPIYLLNEEGVGKKGPDSGFAYEWVKQTGEKVWVVNAAHGGSAISTWQDGGANYEECVLLFKACLDTLQKEIDAGHYTLSHMGYFWCQGCSDASQTAQWYVQKYLTMHENLKTELAFDDETTFEFGGIIPVRAGHVSYTSYRQGVYADTTNKSYHESFLDLRFTGPRVAQYWMTNNPDLPDIWNVCNIGEDWVWMPDGTNGVSEYFQSHYPNGTVDYEPQVPQTASWYTPTTPAAVHDSIHYNQIGYNEVGREAARNALILLGEIPEPEVETSVTFLGWDGYREVTEIPAATAGSSGTLVVPKVYPVWKSKEVTYTLSENLTWNYYDLLADSPLSSGTLTGAGKTVTVTGRELASYRWELENDILVSVGQTDNPITRVTGTVENGLFIDTQYRLEKPFVLLHDQNWVLEWKMTGPWYDDKTTSRKLFCQDGASASAGALCLIIKGNENRISIGYYGTNTHVSYGLDLDAYGISMADTHVYRLVNHRAEDGSNTIYLFVDGVQVGPMTRYFTGSGGDMGEDVNWLSGRDISFGYLGTPSYLLDQGIVHYISVMETGAEADIHFHDWSDWEETRTPGPDGPGEKRRICSGCGQTETVTVDSIWQTTNILDHWSELPEDLCCGVNLWELLEHDPTYYVNSKGDWGYHSSRDVPSVTIQVTPGDKIFATSFGPANTNGHGSSNGIRVTWFDIDGVLKTTDPAGTYAEYTANGGYLVAPEGAVALNIPMWGDEDSYEIYILNREHRYGDWGEVTAPTCTAQGYTTYTCACGHSYVDDYTEATGHSFENGICIGCGEEHPNLAAYEGKVISILGDSISTFTGWVPTADGFNLLHRTTYPKADLLTDVNETWWLQTITMLNAKLGINDSWSSTEVYNYIDEEVNGSYDGTKACMASLTRIQNLGANGTPDVILFFGGTNDTSQNRPLGTFDPATAPTEVDLTSVKWESVADAYVDAIMRMQYFYPDTQIVAMLPFYRSSQGTAKVNRYNDLFAAICEHYGVLYVDLRTCGITDANLPDRTHPDAEGMDLITTAVMEVLMEECTVTPGENVVYSVTHNLTEAGSTMGYYKGVSHGEAFTATITGENLVVTVTMGGVDITAECYAEGVISIAQVTGDLVITAQGRTKPVYEDYLQELPEELCTGVNLWTALEPINRYYRSDGWGVNATGLAHSITFAVSPGDRIWATSFQESGLNGGTKNGIALTWFDADGVIATLSPEQTYAEFAEHGCLTAPESAVAVNVVMWNGDESNEVYLLDYDHVYQDGECTICGAEDPAYHVPGDITGDGVVNNKDLMRLFRHLSGYDVEVNEPALDTTGDGSVNNKDLMRLFRYLSGYDVELH